MEDIYPFRQGLSLSRSSPKLLDVRNSLALSLAFLPRDSLNEASLASLSTAAVRFAGI